MESIRDIKKRIRSVKNISQITKAMEAVSATKMRRSQSFAISARPYAVAALKMLENLLSRISELPPLLKENTVHAPVALFVVTSDKGLAGAFNSAVLRKAEMWIADKKRSGEEFCVIAVGKKARDKFAHLGVPMGEQFIGFGDYTQLRDTLPVADYIIEGFRSGVWSGVYAVYTNFRSTLKQEAVLKHILPVTREGIEEIVSAIIPERGRFSDLREKSPRVGIRYQYEYAFEPSAAEVLETLIPQLLRVHIHHIILESNASEHSARMVAMKSASENAGELISELSLIYNKSRQAGITRELTEITAGTEALGG